MRIRDFLKSKYFSNIIILIGGSGTANLLPLLLSPLVMRFYKPDAYATFSFFLACVSVLSIFCNGRYSQAIVLPKRQRVASYLVYLSVSLSILFGVIILLGSLLSHLGAFIPKFDKIEGYFSFLLPPGLVLFIVFETINFWLNRNSRYDVMARMRVIKSVATETFNVVLGYNGFAAIGLIIAFLSGYFFAILFAVYSAHLNTWFIPRLSRLMVIAKRYKDFPLFVMPSSMADTFSLQAPIFFLTQYFPIELVGFFAFSQRIIAMPTALIGQAMSQVYYQELSSCSNENRSLFPVYFRTCLLLLAVALPITGTLYFFAQPLFTVFFGETWREAGIYVSILAPAFFVRIVVSPLSPIFFVKKKMKLLAFWKWLYFVSTVSMLYLGCMFLDFKTLIVVYSAHEVVLYSIYFVLQVIVIRR